MSRTHGPLEESEEGYFASISDLMVGILFIFLLMLAAFAINYATEDKDKKIAELERQVEDLKRERDWLRELLIDRELEIAWLRVRLATMTEERDRLREAIRQLSSQLDGVSHDLGSELGRLVGVRETILRGLQEDLKARGVPVEIDTGPGILRLLSDGLFVSGEATFTEEGRRNAQAVLEEMVRILPCYSTGYPNASNCPQQPQAIFETVLIEGHTDARPAPHLPGGNWSLSTDRARAFQELMKGPLAGLQDLRNAPDQRLIGLAGYGDTRPRRGIPPEDAGNRRIEVRFLLSAQPENIKERVERLEKLLKILKELGEPSP
jgi:flagellar motor protein MotB